MDAFRLLIEDHEPRRRVIGVQGELDLATMDLLTQAIEAARSSGRDVTVDLGTCAFIDSCGIRTLINGADGHRRAGLDYEVVCPQTNRPVARVIGLIGLGQLITVREEFVSGCLRES